MLSSSLKKRIFLIVSTLFIILIIYIFPKDKPVITTVKQSKQKETIIYLKDKNNYMSRVGIYIDNKSVEDKIREIIKYLTINSNNSNYIKNGFSPVLPNGTKLLSLSIDKSLVKLNFSKELLDVNENDEENMISSLIYSITSLNNIDSISIYVENNILTNLPNSKRELEPVLNRSFGINKKYNIDNFNNITSTTIYYLSKDNDYYYYVPVTIINNEKKDKMDIIIKELASKASYQTGLISYIKSVNQISYELNNDILEVKLNSDLYLNLNDEDLLESAIYSLNLSIKDNTDAKEVIYYLDNNIYKTYYI